MDQHFPFPLSPLRRAYKRRRGALDRMLKTDVPPSKFVDDASDAEWAECVRRLLVIAAPAPPSCSHLVRLWWDCKREDRVAQFVIALHAATGAPLGYALNDAIRLKKLGVADALAGACPLAGDGPALWRSLCSATCNIPMQRMLIERHPDVVYAMLSAPGDCPLRFAVRTGVTFAVFVDLVTKLRLPLPPLIDAEWQGALEQNERRMDKTNADAIRCYIDPAEHRARVLAVAQGMRSASPLACLPDSIVSNFIAPHMRTDYTEHIRPFNCPDKQRRDYPTRKQAKPPP